MASVTPFGYVYDAETGQLQPHPEYADIVRQMFHWAADGDGLYAISTRLEAAGVKVPLPPGKQHIAKKREWHVTTVWKMLTHPRYIGKATYAGHAMACPALVDEETFEAARERLTERGQRMKGRVTRTYMLRGLVYCRFCGGACRSKTDSKPSGWTQAVYECTSRA